MRIIDISKIKYNNKLKIKTFDNSFLLQDKDSLFLIEKLKFVTKISLKK